MNNQRMPPNILDRVRALLPRGRTAERRMFGGVTFLLNGNMLCCVSPRGLMVRVGKDGEPTLDAHLATGQGRAVEAQEQPPGCGLAPVGQPFGRDRDDLERLRQSQLELFAAAGENGDNGSHGKGDAARLDRELHLVLVTG